MISGRLEDASFFYSQALELAEQTTDNESISRCLVNLVMASRQAGKIDDSIRWLERARGYETQSDFPSAVTSMDMYAYTQIRTGDYLAARKLLQIGLSNLDNLIEPRDRNRIGVTQLVRLIQARFSNRVGMRDTEQWHFAQSIASPQTMKRPC